MENVSACPRDFNCSGHEENVSFSIGAVPSYVSLVSSSFSLLGSVLIFLAFLMLPEIRTGAQKLITLLSVADFFTAFGYFMAAINFLRHYRPLGAESHDCGTFETVCKIQSFITTTSSMSSFLWTMILAVYFHVVIVNKQKIVKKKMFALFNVIAWGLPIAITIPLLATDYLGYSPLATSNWCYIKDSEFNAPKSRTLILILFLIAGKFWEVLSYIVVTVLYISIAFSIYQSRRKLALTHNSSARISRDHIELRLLSIPVVFLLLRIWGTTQFVYSLSHMHLSVKTCIPRSMQRIFLGLGILQAIGDSGQGWSNAILYIFLSPTIRKLFICETLINCCSRLQFMYQLCNGPVLTSERGLIHSSNEPIGTMNDDVIDRQEALNRPGNHVNRCVEGRALNRSRGDSSLCSSYGAVTTNATPSDRRLCQDGTQPATLDQRKELLDTAALKYTAYSVRNNKT